MNSLDAFVWVNKMHWIDTHAHLAEAEFKEDLTEVIQRAIDRNVKTIVLIGVGIEGSKRALALAKTNTMFKVALGFHPEEVLSLTEADWTQMEAFIQDPLVIAVGEIGLDHHWDKDPQTHIKQIEVFKRQIDLANHYHLPIIVHSRDAHQATFDILNHHPAKYSGILHCYSGSLELAQEYIKCGYHIGLGGPVTFKNAIEPKEVAKHIDLNYLHIETDAPYLAPTPHRGKRNESAFVIETAAVIATLRDMNLEDLKKALYHNFKTLFKVEP
jgi:TatD DNase family protein